MVRAADYGVPQLRERFFMVALARGEFSFRADPRRPDAQHSLAKFIRLYRTAWDALGE